MTSRCRALRPTSTQEADPSHEEGVPGNLGGAAARAHADGMVAVAEVGKSGAPRPRLRARILSRWALHFHVFLHIYFGLCDIFIDMVFSGSSWCVLAPALCSPDSE